MVSPVGGGGGSGDQMETLKLFSTRKRQQSFVSVTSSCATWLVVLASPMHLSGVLSLFHGQ
jgi:hypothetical protein